MTTNTLQVKESDGAAVVAAAVETPTYLGPCVAKSWNPEVFDFYGDAASILDKIDDAQLELGDRRMYFLLVESQTGAEIRFFERVNDELTAVFSWSGESAGDLKTRIGDVILDNHGVNCVGEQLKALVTKNLSVQLEGTVPAPTTSRAAFAHTIRNNSEYLRATTALLC